MQGGKVTTLDSQARGRRGKETDMQESGMVLMSPGRMWQNVLSTITEGNLSRRAKTWAS